MRLFIFLLFPVFCLGQTTQDQIQAYFDQKEFQKAEKLIRVHLEKEPNNPTLIECLGDAYSYQKQFEKARSEYKKLVEKFPDSAEYHYKYGAVLGLIAKDASKLKALRMLGDIKNHLKTAANLNQQHIDVRWALVELYVQLPAIVGGGKKKALGYAQQLQEISPVDGHLAKGYIYEYKENPQKAEMYYKMAIDSGGSLTCYGKLTDLYEKENEPLKAIGTIEQAQEKHERNALHYQIGKIAAEYNVELAKGERCLLTYIKDHTIKDGIPVEWAYLRLAQIYKHKMNKEKALFWVDKALSVQQNFKEAAEEKAAIGMI